MLGNVTKNGCSTRKIKAINSGPACSVLFEHNPVRTEHDGPLFITLRQFPPPCPVRIFSMSKTQSDCENPVMNCLNKNCFHFYKSYSTVLISSRVIDTGGSGN